MRLNFWNSLSMSSGGIPTPLSATLIITGAFGSAVSSSPILPPFGVYLLALLSRFSTSMCTNCRSAVIGNVFFGTSIFNFWCRSSIVLRCSLATSSTSLLRSTCLNFNFTSSLSVRATYRRLLTISSWCSLLSYAISISCACSLLRLPA